MRLKVSLNPDPRKGVLIPFDYQYELASAIMRVFQLAGHDVHGKRCFYTFSRLFGGRVEDRGLRFEHGASLVFSSPDFREVNAFLVGLLELGQLELFRVRFEVERVEVFPTPASPKATLKTLSPVTVYSKDRGKRRFYSPEEAKFSEVLSETVLGDFQLFSKKTGSFSVVKVANWKRKKLEIKDTSYTAYEVELTVAGDPEVVKFAVESGLGKKRKLGFGCVEVVEVSPNPPPEVVE